MTQTISPGLSINLIQVISRNLPSIPGNGALKYKSFKTAKIQGKSLGLITARSPDTIIA